MGTRINVASALGLAAISLVATGIAIAPNADAPLDIAPVSQTQSEQAWAAFDAKVAPAAKSSAKVELIGETPRQITAYNLLTVKDNATGDLYLFSFTR